jgi:predicted N-acetyltransferase YhbS
METETRACRAEELPALLALVNRVFRAGGQGEMRAEYPLVFGEENLPNIRIVPGDAGPLAHVGVCLRDVCILGARLRVAGIGAVCTDPEHRGLGFASALMEDARRHAREQGACLMLISGGRGLYHRLGYFTVGCFHRYQWSAAQLRGVEVPGIELSGFREEELEAIVALHQAEPVRYLRDMTDWRRLLAARMLMNAPSELLTIRHATQLVAYVGVQRPRGGATDAGKEVRIQEFAGSRRAILAALPAIVERYSAGSVSLTAQPVDAEMAVQVRHHGGTATRVSFPGTLGVIEPPALLEALHPLLAERATASADLDVSATAAGVSFALGAQRYAVAAPGPLAALLFGGDTEEARSLPARQGPLGALLETLFPLPLVWYGYNYV